MKVIGIVGGMGAGKSTVIALWNEMHPISCISADVIGHDILLKGNPAYEPIIEAFGTAILDETGEIVRKKLGECAFKTLKSVQKLNAITHPLIIEEVTRQIKEAKMTKPSQHIILEAALLIESGLVSLTDCVIAVYADTESRLKRIVKREGLTEEHILKRFKAQKEWKELEASADYIIDNSISLDYTREQIDRILEQMNQDFEN